MLFYLLLTLFLVAPKHPPPVVTKTEIVTSPTEISAYVRKVQHEYGLTDVFYETLRYESAGFQNIQSLIVKNGKREESYGIAQIHLPSHPSITREQALTPHWAIEWAAKEWKAGRQWQWTGWYVVRARSAPLVSHSL